jgi:glycosyltransferase involved in cell wall biosynthesis
MKKKVIVLAYDFPPYHSVAAQRPSSWLKYFPQFDIDITVVTRQWDEWVQSPLDYIKPSSKTTVETENITATSKIVRAPFKPNLRDRLLLAYGMNRLIIFRKILSAVISIGKFYVPSFDETCGIRDAANELMKKEKFDIIIATGEPFILFKHAAELSCMYRVPWVADYRDCWTNAPKHDNLRHFEKLIFSILQIIEKRIIKTASLITTASPSYKERLQRLHPGKKIEVIYNGSDIDSAYSYELLSINAHNDCFEIAYAGIFYEHQQLEMFLEGYYEFIMAHGGLKTRAVFYGIDFYPEMKERLLRYKNELRPYLLTTSRMPYHEVMKKLRQAHVFLLLTNEGSNWLNAKVFDYLALKRPILLVKNDKGILEQILDETKSGFKASTANEVAQHLEKIHQEFFLNKANHFSPVNTEFYTRKKQAEIFADILKKLK